MREMTTEQKAILEKNPAARVTKLLYLGCRRGSKTKRLFGYVPITDAQIEALDVPAADQTRYYKKSLYPGTPGTIIEIVEEGDSIYNKGRRYVGRWQGEGDCTKWQVQHDEVNAEIRDEKVANYDAVISGLQAITAAYRKANKIGRAALLNKVIRYITSSGY